MGRGMEGRVSLGMGAMGTAMEVLQSIITGGSEVNIHADFD
jgi:hypothetical protein